MSTLWLGSQFSSQGSWPWNCQLHCASILLEIGKLESRDTLNDIKYFKSWVNKISKKDKSPNFNGLGGLVILVYIVINLQGKVPSTAFSTFYYCERYIIPIAYFNNLETT